MADTVEYARIKYVKGLQAVVDAMRECTELAEMYMTALNDPDAVPHDNSLKRKRGKGKDLEDDGGKRKRVKDPNAPKRPASSYILFQNDVRQTIKEKYPDLSPSELRALISQEWANLKDDQKDHYKKAAESHKEKYMADKAAYAARSPEEVAAAASEVKEKPKRGKPAQKKTGKSPEKVQSPESSPEPEVAPVKHTSSAPETEDSSEETGSSDEEEAEEDEEDEEEPTPKKAKVSEKPVSKRKSRA